MLPYLIIKTMNVLHCSDCLAGVRGKFLSALQSLYDNVSWTVRVNHQFTPWFKVNAGVKQGCLISPSLFAVYINDLAQRINDLQCGIKIDDIFLSILLYADDIALIAPDELKLQQMLDVVTSWCSEWKLHINASKTQIVHFRNPSVQRRNFIFTCSNSNIEYVESYIFSGDRHRYQQLPYDPQ